MIDLIQTEEVYPQPLPVDRKFTQ